MVLDGRRSHGCATTSAAVGRCAGSLARDLRSKSSNRASGGGGGEDEGIVAYARTEVQGVIRVERKVPVNHLKKGHSQRPHVRSHAAKLSAARVMRLWRLEGEGTHVSRGEVVPRLADHRDPEVADGV
eukprot:CAMPEP_0179952436 /NCGR_PEP_ID=MMETSP0983-20121128/24265_1 /TAXON_ID=483367 /ORGANISM="non described non described, Strain CCMP 2436" /LENGTH=127 /DNA_ID=CAMNT_0021863037 /DNA_START=411 /DNA_END=793 /DNA_ORIENTATION=+